jgi:hypothetical protein
MSLAIVYGLIEERSRRLQKHDQHVEKVIPNIPPQSTLFCNHMINIFIHSRSCVGFGKSYMKNIQVISEVTNLN